MFCVVKSENGIIVIDFNGIVIVQISNGVVNGVLFYNCDVDQGSFFIIGNGIVDCFLC